MNVILVAGEICSGKTTYLSSFSDEAFDKVDVSDIVRSITKDERRRALPHLDVEIIKELKIKIKESDIRGKDIIIAGPRQLDIVLAVEMWCKIHQYPLEYHILEVDRSIRNERYLHRSSRKDQALTFDEAEKSDKVLGIDEVMSYFYTRTKAKLIQNGTQYGNSIDDSL